MKSSPLVTIGSANYNNAKYVIETLNSIKKQTYLNVEFIIVDDCSTDNSIDLINEWLKGFDKPYKFIVHEKNLGLCATVNDILCKAKGKYISFIATDDIMMPDKIKVQVESLEDEDEDVAAVYSDVYLIDEFGKRNEGSLIANYFDFKALPEGDIFIDLAKKNFIPAMSVLCKRECMIQVGGFDEGLAYEDYDMWLKMSLKFKFVTSNYFSCEYRVHSQSMYRTRGLAFQLTDIKLMLKYIGYNKEIDAIYKSRLSLEIEDVYRKTGRQHLNLLFTNFKLNPKFKFLVLLLAGCLNIDFRTIDKIKSYFK